MSFDHDAAINREVVRRFGRLGGARWLLVQVAWRAAGYLRFGRTRMQLFESAASLFNGSWHCGYLHAAEFELRYFGASGRLFPLDEAELVALSRESDDALRRRLEEALAQAGMRFEAELVNRLYALHWEGARPRSFTDRLLLHCAQLFELVNYSCISEPKPLERPSLGTPELERQYAAARTVAGR